MSDKGQSAKEPAAIIQEVTQRMDDFFVSKKEEIDKALAEKINLEKEEARKKVDELEKKFAEDKNVLEKHRIEIDDLRREKESLRGQLDEHLKQAAHYQGLIEKMANITVEELVQVREIRLKLETVRQKTIEKVTMLQKDIRERFGFPAQIDVPAEEESGLDFVQEHIRLKKIIELLRSEEGAADAGQGEAIPAPEEPAGTVSEPAPAASPEEPAEAVPAPGPPAEAREDETEMPKSGSATPAVGTETFSPEELESVKAALEKCRKANPTNINGDIIFYEKDKRMVIDGESLIHPMAKTLDDAGALHALLVQKESPKEQFFIKQDIINQQEILRKIYLKTVKLCEKENYSMPVYTADILSVSAIKDILEKLSLGNWSNQYDFDSFRNQALLLIKSFHAKTTPPLAYLKSILRQLEED